MKKLIFICLMLCMVAPCFAGPMFYIDNSPTKKQELGWTACSVILIFAGLNVMVNANNNMATNLTGAGLVGLGVTGLYIKVYEFER